MQEMKHERRVVGHVSGWKEQMGTCVCGAKWPCTMALAQMMLPAFAQMPLDGHVWHEFTVRLKREKDGTLTLHGPQLYRMPREQSDLSRLLREAHNFVGKSRCSQGHSVSEVQDRAKPGHMSHCIYCKHQVELYERLSAALRES